MLPGQGGAVAKYVVAGVTGRTGSVVADALLARGDRPTVVVRDSARGAAWSRRGATVAVGSLDDESFLSRTLEGAAGCFALLPENVSPQAFHEARRRMADAMAAAVTKSGVPHVALLSAIAAVLPEGNGPFLPFGMAGAFAALPFAVWLFLAIEQLPLAAEETHDPKQDMPKGLILGMATLVVSAFLTMFLNAGVGSTEEGKMHGAFTLGGSLEPLLDGFRVTIGGFGAKALALLAVIGLIASFHTIIFAYGRQIFSLSRAGYFPQALSVTHGAHKTPNRALYGGTVLGFAVMIVVWTSLGAEKGGALIGGTLLNMAVFGAMISYAMQGLSFILLRRNMPTIARPYRSPAGSAGAAVTVLIALFTLYYQLKDPVYRNGVIGVAIWYLAGIAYFALVGRHKLVLSPEEEFALTRGEHGRPETEGYGHTTI